MMDRGHIEFYQRIVKGQPKWDSMTDQAGRRLTRVAMEEMMCGSKELITHALAFGVVIGRIKVAGSASVSLTPSAMFRRMECKRQFFLKVSRYGKW
jgi:hypothetical protein